MLHRLLTLLAALQACLSAEAVERPNILRLFSEDHTPTECLAHSRTFSQPWHILFLALVNRRWE
jgi:hypothetical protein